MEAQCCLLDTGSLFLCFLRNCQSLHILHLPIYDNIGQDASSAVGVPRFLRCCCVISLIYIYIYTHIFLLPQTLAWQYVDNHFSCCMEELFLSATKCAVLCVQKHSACELPKKIQTKERRSSDRVKSREIKSRYKRLSINWWRWLSCYYKAGGRPETGVNAEETSYKHSTTAADISYACN